jgi:hypothetical protein
MIAACDPNTSIRWRLESQRAELLVTPNTTRPA